MIEGSASASRPPGAARRLLPWVLGAAIAGTACVLGFAPFYAWPVPIAALAALLFAWTRCATPGQAFLVGFAFGLGLFLGGVSWVYVSLHRFGQMPALLAALATFLFCAYLALFPAMAGWLARRLARDGSWIPWLGAATFVLFEWLRSWLFTGFPWLTLGTSQAPAGALAGWLALAGGYGTSFAMALAAAGALGLAWPSASLRARLGSGAVVLAVLGAGLAAGAVAWTSPAGPAVKVALLQGNVAQDLKWREDMRIKTLRDYRAMIAAVDARIVVVPETALPAFYDDLPREYIEGLRQHAAAAGKEILLGTVEREFRGTDFDYFNSLVRLTGKPGESYRKHHLVPFGEFIPWGFHWVLNVLHIPLSDFARGPATQAPLEAGGVAFGVAICYEDIFGEEVIGFLPRAQALVNVSNDAWFGESWAAEQHLQSSQARAIETGRWMVRATNTGVTAAIDPAGQVASRLPAFVAGTLVQAIVPMQGMTPYARGGNAPAVVLAGLVLLAAFLIGRRP